MRSGYAVVVALGVGLVALSDGSHAGAYQEEERGARIRQISDRSHEFLVTGEDLPAHNLAKIEKDRHAQCVSGLQEITRVVSRLEELKTSPGVISTQLPDLQKSFKELSKRVTSNCF